MFPICLLMFRPDSRLERGAPDDLLKLRQMGTQGVNMKGVLPWLFCGMGTLACTKDFYPALADLVGPVLAAYTI